MPHEFQKLFNHRTASYGSDKNCSNCIKGVHVENVIKESKGKICKWTQIKCSKFPCWYDSKSKTFAKYNTLSFKVCDAWASKI